MLGLLSSEILVDPADPRAFIAISHFVDQAAAERSLGDPEHSAWRRRLASLSEAHLVQRDMLSLWRASQPSIGRAHPARSQRRCATMQPRSVVLASSDHWPPWPSPATSVPRPPATGDDA